MMEPGIQSMTLNASSQIFSSRKKLNPIEEEALNELNARLAGSQKQSSASQSPDGEGSNH